DPRARGHRSRGHDPLADRAMMRALPPAYSVPRSKAPIDLRLDANEGAPSPEGLLDDIDPAELLRRYPDVEPLTAAFADRVGGRRDRVLVRAGADEALARCCRLLVGRGIEFVFPEPGFAMPRRYAALAGADIVSVPWTEGPYPTDAVLAAVTERTGAIVFTSP